jgi:hypothetical protein
MWRSALRPQRCLISTCISGSAPRSSRLVLSAGPKRVSGWQPPVRFCASSAGTSARCLLRFRASNRATTKHAQVDLDCRLNLGSAKESTGIEGQEELLLVMVGREIVALA